MDAADTYRMRTGRNLESGKGMAKKILFTEINFRNSLIVRVGPARFELATKGL